MWPPTWSLRAMSLHRFNTWRIEQKNFLVSILLTNKRLLYFMATPTIENKLRSNEYQPTVEIVILFKYSICNSIFHCMYNPLSRLRFEFLLNFIFIGYQNVWHLQFLVPSIFQVLHTILSFPYYSNRKLFSSSYFFFARGGNPIWLWCMFQNAQ